MSDLRSFVRDLDIGPVLDGSVDLDGPAASAAVVSGCVAVFSAATSTAHKRDVLQCLLLAQLAANAKADRHRDATTWYGTYQKTLEQVGWVVSASSRSSRFRASTAHFTIGDVAADSFKERNEPGETAAVAGAFQSFAANPGLAANLVFECPSHSGGIGNLQVALADEVANGTVGLQVLGVTFETPEYVARLVTHDFGEQAKIQVSYTASTLNEQTFGKVRAAIDKKLAGRFDASVAVI
ncbi:hypothetical protein [Actinoplanes palleronii]|uniref:Uncharacterized protein n=1 Tax=Actinoplanes palleronii TaxID=113570 RepID=A0ABQ4B5S1_9ACTN|nr:hypothetical protein [Actinoplanes palleronii]GIE65605.1 hypothetical protein Apa02nite_017130 [Actinoplanes palleronii]